MTQMRESFGPIMDQFGVDLIVSGHSHSYERSMLIQGHYGLSTTFDSSMIVDGGNGSAGGDGTYVKEDLLSNNGAVYAVAGSSGKTSIRALDHPVMVSNYVELGSMVLDVSGNSLHAVFLNSQGLVLDDFDIQHGNASGVIALDVSVTDGNDDAEERASGSVNLDSTDLELVEDPQVDPLPQTLGIRFASVAVPVGATITDASLQFTVDEVSTGAANLVIQADATGSSAAIEKITGNITNRTMTSAAISWTPPEWTVVGEAGADQRTPDLAAIVQEIIDQPDWVSGNPITFVMTGTGRRTAESYDGSPASAPLLHLEWQ